MHGYTCALFMYVKHGFACMLLVVPKVWICMYIGVYTYMYVFMQACTRTYNVYAVFMGCLGARVSYFVSHYSSHVNV